MTQQEEIELDKTQQHAVDECCNLDRRIVPITGKAGTGKTIILRTVHDKLTAFGLSVILCAPTGKAAKRIQEITGISALTNHRMLKYPYPGEKDEKTGKHLMTTVPQHDRRDPIPADVILADEYAMTNQEVHRNILDALRAGACIRMFGDANQLAPIESNKILQAKPSPFVSMLTKFDGIILNTIHRQSEGNVIIENGARILSGIIPKRTDTYSIKFTEKPVEAIEDWVMESGYDFKSNDVQIITPTRVGWVGTEALNARIQGLMHDPLENYNEIERHTWSSQDNLMLFVGDKVIQTVNQYDLGVFNGETGIVIEMEPFGKLVIDFGDKILEYPLELSIETKTGLRYINPQRDLDLAYCITTHKTQGSEYKHITYVMNRSRSFLLNRKNLYTGQSRAKDSVHIITDQKALQLSLAKRG